MKTWSTSLWHLWRLGFPNVFEATISLLLSFFLKQPSFWMFFLVKFLLKQQVAFFFGDFGRFSFAKSSPGLAVMFLVTCERQL